MQFKSGSGWKACYDEERNLYTAETWCRGDYDLYEIDAETFRQIGTPETDDLNSEILIKNGRHLYMAVDDGRGMPYSHVFDWDYEALCPWAKIQRSDHPAPEALTDIGVALFENEKTQEHRNSKKE